jgi:hypothetical protein
MLALLLALGSASLQRVRKPSGHAPAWIETRVERGRTAKILDATKEFIRTGNDLAANFQKLSIIQTLLLLVIPRMAR